MLVEWLQDPQNPGRSVTAGSLFGDLTVVARKHCEPWPVSNAKVLGQRLSHIQINPQAPFKLETSLDAHTKQNLYRLWPKEAPAAASLSEAKEEESLSPAIKPGPAPQTTRLGTLSGVEFERAVLNKAA